MLEFLLSLLLFAFGLGNVNHPAFDPETLANRIRDHIAQVTTPQGNPQADPESSYQGGLEVAENGPELPPQAQANNQEPQNSVNPQNDQENSANPDTTKIATYNQESERYIGQVAAVAVDNAEPLIPCAEAPTGACDESSEPLDTPDPTPTPIPTPEPTPIILPIEIPPKPPHGCDPPPPFVLGVGNSPHAPYCILE